MKICLITSSFPSFPGDYSGIFVYELAQYLTQRGHEVHVVTPMHPRAIQRESREGIHILRFRYRGWENPGVLAQLDGIPLLSMTTYILAAIRMAARVIRQQDIDVVHAYWVIPAGFIGVVVGKLTGRPVVASAPGSDLNLWPQRLLPRLLVQLTLRQLHGLFALGTELRDNAIRLGVAPGKVLVNLGNGGINLELFKPPGKRHETRWTLGIADEASVVLFVGRLGYPKRVDLLLQAIRQLRGQIPTARLLIIGDGPDAGALGKLCHSLLLNEVVSFLGVKPHDDIPMFLEAADVFIYASESEGLPSGIMEALAMGRPVIASEVGGIPDLVQDDYNGFLVPPGDVDAMADRLVTLLSDRGLASRLGQNAGEFALRHLDKEVIMPRIEAVYSQVL